eukprot:TRINITY_DN12057_c0_g1_i1.p1 TRINITY_DN12057_c0_g1~~TRINITY_DN12057_c0_g1_i1.p1  ORF type:complete len:135 (-),score=18.82 TRINITY_DN12057_c0_g1_i1:204-608(-)
MAISINPQDYPRLLLNYTTFGAGAGMFAGFCHNIWKDTELPLVAGDYSFYENFKNIVRPTFVFAGFGAAFVLGNWFSYSVSGDKDYIPLVGSGFGAGTILGIAEKNLRVGIGSGFLFTFLLLGYKITGLNDKIY